MDPLIGRSADRDQARGETMTISAGELAAESLEAQAVFRAAELIAEQRVRQINEVLAGHGSEFRVFPGEARLTEAAVRLAEAQNGTHTHDNDEQAAEVSRATRALDLTQHQILLDVFAAHIRRTEIRLVSAVGALHQANEIGLGLGMDVEDWTPSPETASLFSGGPQ
jgi:hypothetical protein